jgi:hypothetical protein
VSLNPLPAVAELDGLLQTNESAAHAARLSDFRWRKKVIVGSRNTGKHFLSLSMVLSLLIIAAVWQADVQTAQAQSVGAFKGAKLELAPPRNSDGSFKSIKAIMDAAGAGGSFYIEGNVFVLGTISDCTLPSGAESLVNASFDPIAKRQIYNDGPYSIEVLELGNGRV